MVRIDGEICIGCELCMVYCPKGAISMKDAKAVVDYDKCVFCHNCVRAAPCPVNCIVDSKPSNKLEEMRMKLTNPFVSRRGGDITGAERPGKMLALNEVEFGIEVGRPGDWSATFKEVQKVVKALIGVKGRFRLGASLKDFFADTKVGKIEKRALQVGAFPSCIDYVVKEDKIPDVIEALRCVSNEMDTYMSIGIAGRIQPDGAMPITKILDDMGESWLPNGKTNLGLCRLHGSAQKRSE